MNFNHIRIILVATSHPGNIGSAARAMKTMGFSRLYLVTPKEFPARLAHELAAGADDVLTHAVVTNSLAEALRGCQRVFATSARPRDLDLPSLEPASCAERVASLSNKTEIALVFGREHAGLTNDELLHAHYHIHIPTHPEFSSLNLAQAVQVMLYELRQKLLHPAPSKPSPIKLATHDEFERFFSHLEEVLIAINFLNPAKPGRLLARLRRMFNRTQLERTELNILRGILTHLKLHTRKTHDS